KAYKRKWNRSAEQEKEAIPGFMPIGVNPDSLAKAKNARETSMARLRANNEARKQKLEKANAEHAEGMNTIAEEQLAEAETDAVKELERMRTEAAANEPEPNSERERLDKLKAIMQKYGQSSDYQVASTSFKSNVEGLDPHRTVYEPSIPVRMNRLYAGEQQYAPPTVVVPSPEGAATVSAPDAPFREYQEAMNRALDGAPQPEEAPAERSMSPEELAAMTQEAARIYQGGAAFEVAPPTPEITKERMEAAAQLYQGGTVEEAGSERPERVDVSAKRESKVASNIAFEKQDMQLAAEAKQRETAYFTALRRSQHGRGFLSAMSERLGLSKGKDYDPSGQLAALRRGWVESRADRAKLMLDSIEARREGRGGAARQGRDIEAVRARYQRMFVVREAVFGAEEAEQKMRAEGLASRDKNLIESVWKGFNKLSPKQKVFLGGGLTVLGGAAAAGSAIATGGGTLIPVLVMSGMGAAAAGLNLASLSAKDGSKLQKFLAGAAKRVTFGGWGGMGGRETARDFNKDTSAAAEKTLAAREQGDLRDAAAFEKLSRERGAAASTRDLLNNRVNTIGAVGATAASIAGGAVVGASLGHIGQQGGPSHTSHEGALAPRAPEHVPAQGPHDPTAENGGFHSFINRHGEGADFLYKDLRDQLAEAYKGVAHPPPVVAELLKFKTMDEFSRATGFESLPNSAVMHMQDSSHLPDTFSLSADAKNLTYMDSHGVAHDIMQETPQHEAVVMSQQDGWIPMRDYTQHAPVQHAVEAQPATAPSSDAIGDKLREIQIDEKLQNVRHELGDIKTELDKTAPASVPTARAFGVPAHPLGPVPEGTPDGSHVVGDLTNRKFGEPLHNTDPTIVHIPKHDADTLLTNEEAPH
ncbi:MAG: hypothetical protein JWO84_741, partial [Parcubacteria group bacterium]|nr:hypothetical protein [Parcubacteria group bacterium]